MARTRKEFLRDVALYLAISVFAVGFLLFALLADWPWGLVLRIFIATTGASLILGQIVANDRKLWHLRGFWLWIVSCLLIHCAVFTFLKLPDQAPGNLVVVVLGIELAVFLAMKRVFVRKESDHEDPDELGSLLK